MGFTNTFRCSGLYTIFDLLYCAKYSNKAAAHKRLLRSVPYLRRIVYNCCTLHLYDMKEWPATISLLSMRKCNNSTYYIAFKDY